MASLEFYCTASRYNLSLHDTIRFGEDTMHMIYNSDNYFVLEFNPDFAHDTLSAGAYEIVDKQFKREIFLGGKMAEHFRKDVQKLIETDPTEEEVDDFLTRFDKIMVHPVVMH